MKKVSFFAALSLSLLLTTAVHNITIHMSTALSTTMISVNPLTSSAPVGQNFTIDINISDVFDLYGWEFRLTWNSTLLDVVNVMEGSFLKQSGDTFFTFKTNNTADYILVDCTLLGSILGVSGNGILATIEFYVETAGGSVLDLNGTMLVSSLEQPITHTSIDGYYYTPGVSESGDLNFDGVINYKDATLFRQAYFGAYNPVADFNQDGVINYKDASLFRGYYIAG